MKTDYSLAVIKILYRIEMHHEISAKNDFDVSSGRFILFAEPGALKVSRRGQAAVGGDRQQ